LILNDSATTTLDYDYVRISLPNISEGDLTINRGTRSKYFNVRYGITVEGDGEEGGTVITLKYKGCKTVADVKAVDANYKTTDIVDGVWSEGLGDLEDASIGGYDGMFANCTNLTTFTSDLSSLTNGNMMFYGSRLASFSSDLPSLTNGSYMFNSCSNLTTFDSDLPSLTNGNHMFSYCFNLTTFDYDLSSLTEGENMFNSCSTLESFSSDLSSLTNGYSMFGYCDKFTSFSSNLSSLTNGEEMFSHCSTLESFSSNLSSLTNGEEMFCYCGSLTSFSSNLSSLTNGYSMFYYCSTLESFSSNLSSLTNGYWMFLRCKLDTASVQNIADTINTVSSGTIHIGIGNTEPNDQEETAFNTMVDKGWIVYVGGNGGSSSQWNPTSLTPIDGEVIQTPIPFYAKPVQSDEEHAQYVDAEGNFYNILGGNYIYGDDLSTYGMFTSEEDAAANMRLTKIGAEEIETA
jgi:hypothetical protein